MGNYNAAEAWDDFNFQVSNGKDPVEAFQGMMAAYSNCLEGDKWDDLRAPATAINPPGQASDPDVEATTGLLLFDKASTELVYVLVQMPHGWKEGTDVTPHIHWTKTTSAAGAVA